MSPRPRIVGHVRRHPATTASGRSSKRMYGGFPMTTSAGRTSDSASRSRPKRRKSSCRTHCSVSWAATFSLAPAPVRRPRQSARHLDVIRSKVVRPDSIPQRREITTVGDHALNQPLNDRAKESAGTAGWLDQMQGAEVSVGSVSAKVQEHFDYPSAGEDLTVVPGGCGGSPGHVCQSRREDEHSVVPTPIPRRWACTQCELSAKIRADFLQPDHSRRERPSRYRVARS